MEEEVGDDCGIFARALLFYGAWGMYVLVVIPGAQRCRQAGWYSEGHKEGRHRTFCHERQFELLSLKSELGNGVDVAWIVPWSLLSFVDENLVAAMCTSTTSAEMPGLDGSNPS